eukprot:CAMPEP_0184678068 /NCGR_PEP_ID=MMETSP0312-20130426/704_1 /TAXON_ID=31354 /ORGANISM="Compsopogon coeruleus, Strain SAG 36.94" /LENGTH=448 /DNA_ID=CAMNT_0027126425 /DNA_START=1455 /DNA_END=2801 /DNA_ORIENTATION=-
MWKMLGLHTWLLFGVIGMGLARTSILDGPLEDCCCEAGTIDDHNPSLLKILESLVKDSIYFRLFRVDLMKSCPYWPDDGVCMNENCAVCPSDDTDVPLVLRDRDSQECRRSEKSRKDDPLNDVDFSLSGLVKTSMSTSPFSVDDRSVWTIQDDSDAMVYVDLVNNPERFTGYAGPSAQRIWSAVYDENCFKFAKDCKGGVCKANACRTERVFFRLISGVHSSISMHIAANYLWGNSWSVNTEVYKLRLRHSKDRIQNLYFALAVVIRAVGKIAPRLQPEHASYKTGLENDEVVTEGRVRELLAHPLLAPGCRRKTFDESELFENEVADAADRLGDFRTAFRNISSIMDCVGCEKCRLWGKLQFLGLGTALKVLFSDQPDLQRNEIVALVNLAAKLSRSVHNVGVMERRVIVEERNKTLFSVLLAGTLVIALSVLVHRRRRTKPSVNQE